MTTNEDDLNQIRRWFSIGDFLSAGAMIIAIAVSYGSMSSRLDSLATDLAEMQSRDMTPGARTEIAALRVKDLSQDASIQELRVQLRDQRSEILESLRRVETKLEEHDSGRGR